MTRPKRIFVISDFKNEKPQSVFMDERKIVKGLVRLGHDVQQFSHRNILLQFSPLKSKSFARRFAKRRVNDILLQQIKYYYPDIVLVFAMKYLTPEAVVAMRTVAPNALFVSRDGNPFPEKFPVRIAIGKKMDIVIMPSSGKFLQTYKDAGVKRCAFIPFCCDPDIQFQYRVEDKWKTDIVFTGKSEHTGLERNDDRYNIVKRLSQMPNAKLYGCFGRPITEGLDCFRSLSNAKIGLSINMANDVRLYHSDRFINIPACSTFTLAKRVPGYDLLFVDGVHMRYFDTKEEFFELADWYLKHEHEREKIAKAGMERAHSEFNCERIAKCILDLIETGTYGAPWAEIL